MKEQIREIVEKGREILEGNESVVEEAVHSRMATGYQPKIVAKGSLKDMKEPDRYDEYAVVVPVFVYEEEPVFYKARVNIDRENQLLAFTEPGKFLIGEEDSCKGRYPVVGEEQFYVQAYVLGSIGLPREVLQENLERVRRERERYISVKKKRKL